MAILQAQHVQFQLSMMGYHTTISIGCEGSLHEVETTCFYEDDQDESLITLTIRNLMHDGDAYEIKSSQGAKWIDYTIEY